jgi:tetratricopeptide (TPR) repeat protein
VTTTLRLALGLALLLAAGPVRAQQAPDAAGARQEAQSLLARGNEAARQGSYLEALDLFRKAYAAFPSPKIHFNLAETCHELGRLVEAFDHYEAFVRDVGREEMPEQWARARERINKLQGETATVQLQANVVGAQVNVDGRPAGETPLTRPLRLLPGPHTIVVTRAGYERQVVELTLVGGGAASPRVKLLTEDEAAASRRAYQELEARRRVTQERLQREQEDARRKRERTRRALEVSGWTALGTGVALLAVGGGLGIGSRQESTKVDGAAAGTPWTELQGHYDRARSFRDAAWAAAAVGAGIAIAGGTLLYLGRRNREATGSAPRVAVGPTGLTLSGQF